MLITQIHLDLKLLIMSYSVGEKVTYIPLTGKVKDATIILRKVDFKEGYISSDYAKGGFDYLISVDGKAEYTFCNENNLEALQ